MKEKVTTKQVKKAARKQTKKEIAKSLKDMMKKSAPKTTTTAAAAVKSNNNIKKKDNFNMKKKQFSSSKKQYSPKKSSSGQQQQKVKKEIKKPHVQLIEGLKTHWNRLRDRRTSIEQRNEILEKLMKAIDGHILSVTLRHDASRIVQAILQFGNLGQKELVLETLQPKLADISKTPYGHFVVLKAIHYCLRSTDQKKIINGLKGHFVSLGTNVIGARIVESILQLFPINLTRGLRAEFYGQKFRVLIAEEPKSLSMLIEALTEKQSAILDHMRDLVQRFIQKGLLEFVYVHNFLWEYIQEVMKLTDSMNKRSRMQDLVNQLCEAAPKLLSTKPGAKVMCMMITYAAAKERKRIIKTLKGHTLESLLHDSAFLGIIRLIDVTDDTVNIQKNILDEIRSIRIETKYTASGEVLTNTEPPLLAIAKHRTGHKLLLRLLTPQLRHLEPDEEILFNEVAETSKKSTDVRRKEHLVYLRSTLINACAIYTEDMMRSRYASKVLEGVIRVFRPVTVMQNVVLIVTGSPPVAISQEDNDNHDDVESDDEEGDDEDDDVQENDDVEEDHSDEQISKNEEEEDDEDADFDMDMQRSLTEDAESNEHIQKSSEDGEGEESVALPIEEDPVVHVLMRRLLYYEKYLQLQCDVEESTIRSFVSSDKFINIVRDEKHVLSSDETIDSSLWVDNRVNKANDLENEPLQSKKRTHSTAADITNAKNKNQLKNINDFSIADCILDELLQFIPAVDDVSKTKLCSWLTKNRTCFVLMKLFSVPSCTGRIMDIFQQSTSKVVGVDDISSSSKKKRMNSKKANPSMKETHLELLKQYQDNKVQGAKVLLQLYQHIKDEL